MQHVCMCAHNYPEKCIPKAHLSGANYNITIRHQACCAQLELGFNWIALIGLLHLEVELQMFAARWQNRSWSATALVFFFFFLCTFVLRGFSTDDFNLAERDWLAILSQTFSNTSAPQIITLEQRAKAVIC